MSRDSRAAPARQPSTLPRRAWGWDSPALLDYLRAYETVGEARIRSAVISTFTIADVHIRVLTTAPRIKPTSTFRRSARRPNHGRAPLIDAESSVQTSGTSSQYRGKRNCHRYYEDQCDDPDREQVSALGHRFL